MKPIQWLLIGGPAHGIITQISQGCRVHYKGTTYQGRNHLENGKLYRIGFVDEKDIDGATVCALIRSTGLKHIAGD